MRENIEFKRYLVGLLLTLVAMLYSLHVAAEPITENAAADVVDTKSARQRGYERLLDHAIGSFPIVGKTWPLKWAKEALKNNVVFDEATTKTLTLSVKNLAATGGPNYQRELPQQYAVWMEVCELMDQAEKAGLYTPPDSVKGYLAEWRHRQAIKAEIDAAPWKVGPTKVAIDPNMDWIYIPRGFRFLPRKEHIALERRLRLLSGFDKARYVLPAEDDDRFNSDWMMPTDSQAWSAYIKVYYGGETSMDDALQSNEALLSTIKSRLQSINEHDGGYADSAVRWIMPPEKNLDNQTIRWAVTNGRVDEPLGIEATHLKIGSKMLVEVGYQDLSAAEYLSTATRLIEGQDPEDYKADNVFKRADTALKPFFDSLTVEVNDLFVERGDAVFMSPTPVSYFITRTSEGAEPRVRKQEKAEPRVDESEEAKPMVDESALGNDDSLIKGISGILLLLLSVVVLFFMLKPSKARRL